MRLKQMILTFFLLLNSLRPQQLLPCGYQNFCYNLVVVSCNTHKMMYFPPITCLFLSPDNTELELDLTPAV